MQRVTLIYLTSYLFLGGLGLLVFPDLALRLLLSNGSYGDVMPRVVGMFMLSAVSYFSSCTVVTTATMHPPYSLASSSSWF